MLPQQMVESENEFKRNVYDKLRVLEGKKPVSWSLQIMNVFPSIKWLLMLGNLALAVASDAVRSVWYRVLQDL